MKKLVVCIGVIFLINTGCKKQEISSLSVETNIEENATLSMGETFDLKIEAKDEDDIESISVDIEFINYHEFYSEINASDWNFNESISIDTVISSGKSSIEVQMIDKNGDIESSSVEIIIE